MFVYVRADAQMMRSIHRFERLRLRRYVYVDGWKSKTDFCEVDSSEVDV